MQLKFCVISPEIDETPLHNEAVPDYVQRLAQQKAQVVLQQHPQAVVIAADTSLSLDGQIIGKPESQQHAFEIWQQLSGRCHQVMTGICVANAHEQHVQVVTTDVQFAQMTPEEMQSYWQTEEPQGKAGAYAIQGLGAQFVHAIHGSYSNVVGLPIFELMQLLKTVKALN